MSRFKKAVKKKELESALAKHPLREIDEQIKKDYVKGLVFVAIEDDNFSDDEKEYITSLMKNIGIDESLIGEFESFAKDADEDAILEFMDRLKAFDADLKLNFMIEVVVLAFTDGDFDESEQAIFDDYIEMLELSEEVDDIMYLSKALANKDIDLALSFYTAKKEKFLKFDYMFDMIGAHIEKSLENIFNYEWTVWSDGDAGRDHTGVYNKNKVSLKAESVQKFCIFLNSQIINGVLRERSGTNSFEYLAKSNLIFEGSDINLIFKNGLFEYENKDSNIFFKESIVKEINFLQEYIHWLNNFLTYNVSILKTHHSYCSGCSDNRYDGRLVFDSNCAGQPDDNTYEFSLGRWRKVDQDFTRKVYFTKGNFGSNLNNWTRSAYPAEFSFRLMKS